MQVSDLVDHGLIGVLATAEPQARGYAVVRGVLGVWWNPSCDATSIVDPARARVDHGVVVDVGVGGVVGSDLLERAVQLGRRGWPAGRT